MYEIKLPNEFITLFKLPRGWFGDGEYSGDISLQPFNAVHLHCDQISTTDHLFNGRPSTLTIPVSDKSYGESAYVEYPNPSAKNLVASVISELTFKIQDSEGKAIDNRGFPVILSIIIK